MKQHKRFTTLLILPGSLIYRRDCYYRDTDGKEIDLILEYNGTVYPIEIKKTGNPGKDSVKNFDVLKNSGMVMGEGAVVCLYNNVLPIDKNNWIIPAWLI